MVLITAGCILQFDFFLHNDFGLYFFLLWFFALSLVTLTMLVSAFLRRASQSTGACVRVHERAGVSACVLHVCVRACVRVPEWRVV